MAFPYADVVEIEQLIAAFNHSVDFGDGVTFGSLFAEDGELDMGQIQISGRRALIEFAEGVPARVPNPRHVVSNVWIEVDGDVATARSYARVHVTPTGEPTTLRTTGRYLDQLARLAEGWVFSRRRFVADPE